VAVNVLARTAHVVHHATAKSMVPAVILAKTLNLNERATVHSRVFTWLIMKLIARNQFVLCSRCELGHLKMDDLVVLNQHK